jgi:putative DNA primase/helicase
LLIDEADTFLKTNDELRGILNSGHRQGGYVLRTVGDDSEPRSFSTYSACAIALIGKLPDTLTDRSVPIALRRRRSDEPVEPFRFDRTGPLDRIARQAIRWAQDNAERVRGSEPEMPANLFNRAADNWRPLLAIADATGDNWPARARLAAAGAAASSHEQSIGLTLLADIDAVFKERGVDRLASAELIAALIGVEGRIWPEFKNGSPITVHGLARLLAPFGIKPETHRIGHQTPRGYMRAQFEDVFARYLPEVTATPQQPP